MRDIRFLLKARYTNSRALIIGIDRYAHASPLSYAVSDASEVRDILVGEFGFLSENVTFLVNEEATRRNILRAYLGWTSEEVDLDDRIFVFFAGHGHTRSGIRGEVGYLVPYDADLSDLSTFIKWDELTGNAELIRAKHMLFIMDACYGGLALTRSLHPGSTRFLKDMLLRYSRQVLTAGKADEVVADSGGPLPDHSVFTGHLIEGLRGRAASQEGVITASGLMSYVYNKVASDKNSRQTPHYGYFDGDGDFILHAPHLNDAEVGPEKGIDSLFSIPVDEEGSATETTEFKVQRVKSLLAGDSSTIQLHDFAINEVRRFLAGSSEDHFAVQGSFSVDELVRRISEYDTLINDLSLIAACVSYWAKPAHRTILQKVISRSADRLESESGLVVWLSLRWYPLVVQLYCSGIAAVEGKRYDSLADVFYAHVGSENGRHGEFFVLRVAEAIRELKRVEAFKHLPGHDRFYTPLSEYLFKVLQPRLDDLLFIGKGYERAFDRFEVLFALVTADLRLQGERGFWGPVGRFGWKHQGHDEGPLVQIINEARAAGDDWEPLRSGLFGGKLERFNQVADELSRSVSRLGWGS